MGLVIAVDGGEAIIEEIDQACRQQHVSRPAQLDQPGRYRTVLDHGPEIAISHRSHLAAAMTGVLVAHEHAVMLEAGARLGDARRDVAAAGADPSQGPGQDQFGRDDADRNARLAAGTGRAVGEVMAAAKATARQIVVEGRRFVADQLGHELSFHAPFDIGARLGGGTIETLDGDARRLANRKRALGSPRLQDGVVAARSSVHIRRPL